MCRRATSPGQRARWHLAEGRAAVGTSWCTWDGGAETFSVLVPRGETSAGGQSPGRWWPAWRADVPGYHLPPGPRGAGGEGRCRGRPSAAAPGEAGSEALALTAVIYSHCHQHGCIPDSSPGKRGSLPCRQCCSLRQLEACVMWGHLTSRSSGLQLPRKQPATLTASCCKQLQPLPGVNSPCLRP